MIVINLIVLYSFHHQGKAIIIEPLPYIGTEWYFKLEVTRSLSIMLQLAFLGCGGLENGLIDVEYYGITVCFVLA